MPLDALKSRRSVPHGGWLFIFVLANIAGAGFGTSLNLIPGTDIIFWLPSGIFLAALLLNRRETWAWWIAGAMAAELVGNVLWFKNQFTHAVLYFMANAAEALVGAWIVQRWVIRSSRSPRPLLLDSPKTSLHFVLLAGGIAPIVGATIIAAIDAIIGKGDFWGTWKLVWLGNGAGVLVAAPLTIAAVQLWRRRHRVSAPRVAEFVFLAGFTVFLTWLALRQLLPTVYVTLPPILWAAVRFQLRGAWAVLVAVLVTVGAFTRTGQGEFAGDPEQMYQRMVALQVFLGVCASSALIVAGLSAVHHHSVSQLRSLASNLDRRVRARTSDLEQSERKLRLAMDATGVGILDVDLVAQRMNLDERAMKILDAPQASLSLTPELLARTVHADDHDTVLRALESSQSVAGHGLLNVVPRVLSSSGEVRWVAVAAMTVFDAANGVRRPIRMIGTVLDITARKRVEAELLEKEGLLRRTLDIAGVGLTRCSKNEIFLSANAAYGEVVGLPLSEIIGRSFESVRGHGAYRILKPYIDRVLRGERVEYIEEVPVPNRGVRCIHGVYTPEENSDGEITGWVASVTDITEHKVTAEQLRRADAERTLNQLLENSTVSASEIISWAPSLLYVYDLNARTSVFQNRPLAELLGYSGTRAQALGDNEWHELMHPDDKARFAEYQTVLDGLASGGVSTFEYRLMHADGTWRWFHSRDVRVGTGHLVIGSASDITERKSIEESLRESEERFRLSLTGSQVVIAQCDTDLRYVWVYDPHPQFKAEALLGKRDSEVSTSSGFAQLEKLKRVVLDTQVEQTQDIDFDLSDGRRTYVFRAEPRFDNVGAVQAIITVAVDISDRKRMEAAVEAARDSAERANRAKDKFLARLSHELRTPLTPVLLSVEALAGRQDLPKEIQASVGMIRRNVEMEISLIDDLLELSRVISGKLKVEKSAVDLNAAVNQACETCRHLIQEKEITLHCQTGAANPVVAADPDRLQQVLLNLLKNASKFTPNGGEIFVTVRSEEGDRLLIEVRDTGIGISEESLSTIFDAFEQSEHSKQYGGLGLGLAISKEIIELHGGAISGKSDGPGFGSTFTISLPRFVEPQPKEETLLSQPDSNGVKTEMRILLVEDNLDTAAVLAELLRMNGYAVRAAHNVADALTLADSEPFDIVVSDIGLPDATGYDLMKRLKSKHQLKGIAMSGYGMEEDIRQSQDAGFDDHIVKPATVAQIERSIRRVTVQAP